MTFNYVRCLSSLDSSPVIHARESAGSITSSSSKVVAEVADRTGLTTAQVINAHTATPWQVGFGGFAPGFAYLVGGDPRLSVPRRSEPRSSVPAGAVGLAGEFTGIYPRRSPGGWQLIGHTDVVLWDIDRPDPALLTPGMWVQFRAA